MPEVLLLGSKFCCVDFCTAVGQMLTCCRKIAGRASQRNKCTQQINGLAALTFRPLNSFRQPFVRRPRGFCHLTTNAAVVDYRTDHKLEYRPLGLASGFPAAPPDQLCLDGFEERFHHGKDEKTFSLTRNRPNLAEVRS